MTLILKSDQKRCSKLTAELINSYTRDQDVYPNNATGAYNMLVSYHSPTSHGRTQVQGHGLAFVQDTDTNTSGRGGRGDRGGGGRGGRGGRAEAAVIPMPMPPLLVVVQIITVLTNQLSNCTQPVLFTIVVQPNVSFKALPHPNLGWS